MPDAAFAALTTERLAFQSIPGPKTLGDHTRAPGYETKPRRGPPAAEWPFAVAPARGVERGSHAPREAKPARPSHGGQ